MAEKKTSYNTAADDFRTPNSLYEKLKNKYGPFDIDLCASKENTKCDKYYTKEDDCLKKEWNGICWCNPPYAVPTKKRVKGIVDIFIKKGLEEIENNPKCKKICYLIPCKPDVAYYHDLIFPNATEIIFIKGRPNFGGPHSCSKASGCRTPIAAIIFEKDKMGENKYSTMSWLSNR